MKALSADSFLARLLGKLAVAICRHPRWFVWPQIVLFFISLAVTIGFLQFDTDRNNLVGGNQLYHHNYLEFQKEFPQQDDLIVVVESENVEKNRQFVERLGARLTAETNLFCDVLFQKDIALMGNKGLQLAQESDLVEMKDAFTTYLPFIQEFTTATNLVSFFDLVNTQFRTAKREENAQTDSLVKAVPALEGILRQARDSLNHPGTPPPPSIAALFGGGESDVASNYITFANGRLFLLTTHAPNEATNDTPPVLGKLIKDAIAENVFHKHEPSGDLTGDAVDRLRQLINETKQEIPGVNVGLIGEPVLDSDEMTQSQKDTTLAGVVSLVLCTIIFIYGYNETGRPLKAIICLLIGLAYTLAFATLAVGHLNVLTITFLPMLIGLAIDFGVHLITRYEEELRHGKTKEAALTKAMVFTGQGIFTGALTTAGAFAAMAFTDFKGIREMGVICGGGLMVCLVPMLTLLPVLLLRGKQNVIDHSIHEDEKRARIENLWLSRPALVTLIIVVTCGLAATQLRKVTFDYNLLDMQSAGLPAVVYQQKLIDSADKSLLFCAVVANNLDEAVRLEKQIRALTNEVADVESIAGFLDQDQQAKLKRISEIKGLVATLQFSAPDMRSVDVYALSRTLYSLSGYVGLAHDEVESRQPELAKQFAALLTSIQEFRKALLAGDNVALAEHADTLGQFQQAMFDNLRGTFATLQQQDDRTALRIEDLPPVLRHRFAGVHGKFLLQVYPRKNVWQRDNQKEFIETLRTALDPHKTNHPVITGTPVQLFEYTSQLKDSYITAAWYSLIAIAIMVYFHFRSLTAVVLALIPVAIGTLWLIGMMGWQDVPFNPANIMTLPLVIGIGVTNGIHILNRFAEERTPGILARSTGKAVLVSGLTAIAGFGSLILAKHRGIHSLGFIMSVGIATCMLAGLTFLPALLNLINRWQPLIKKPGVSRTSPTPGQEEPR
jgi:hopanoid biosynthesis associated RND transporter like protein HpnN